MSVSSCGPIGGGIVRIVTITIKAVVNNIQIVSNGLRVNFCRSCIRWSFSRLSKWNCISPSWRQRWRTLCWSSDIIRIFVVVLPGNYRLIIGILCLIVSAGMSKCIVPARPVVDRGSHDGMLESFIEFFIQSDNLNADELVMRGHGMVQFSERRNICLDRYGTWSIAILVASESRVKSYRKSCSPVNRALPFSMTPFIKFIWLAHSLA